MMNVQVPVIATASATEANIIVPLTGPAKRDPVTSPDVLYLRKA
jgi:hypothetical protein